MNKCEKNKGKCNVIFFSCSSVMTQCLISSLKSRGCIMLPAFILKQNNSLIFGILEK